MRGALPAILRARTLRIPSQVPHCTHLNHCVRCQRHTIHLHAIHLTESEEHMTTPPEGYPPYQGAPGQTGPQPAQPPQYQQPYQPQPTPPAYQPQPYPQGPQYAPPPGYAAPQYGQPPQYAPTPQQQQAAQRQSARGGRSGWVACGIIAVILLVLCGGAGVGAYFIGTHVIGAATDSVGVVTTVTQFCEAEQTQSYSQAYTYFSNTLQQQISASTFEKNSQQLDSSKGQVATCQQQNNAGPQISGSSATQAMQVIRNNAATGDLHLVKQGNSWLIDSIDTSLTLT